MKIAVPTAETKTLDSHFGHCEFYLIYTIENNKISNIEKLESPQTCGCKSNIAYILAEKGVSVMLVGGIGQGAINVLNSVGIDVIRGCSGNTDELVNNFIQGKIIDSGNTCSHHDHASNCNH